jgi:RNA polymerase sigma-70 factor (ECF subfamily)
MGLGPDGASGDGDVVALVHAGDPTGLDALFGRYAQVVYGFCWRRLGPVPARNEAAEDVMSIVFLEVWVGRDRMVLVDDSARPWLLGVAAKVLANERRSRRRHAAALARYKRFEATRPQIDPADEAARHIDSAASGARAIAALGALGTRERVVADLCLVEGMATRDAAQVLGLPDGTVKSRLDRARRHLRAVLRTGDMTDLEPSIGHQRVRRAPRAAVDGSSTA